MSATPSIVWFDQAASYSPETIGEKGVDAGRLFSLNLPIPEGFIIPSAVFQTLLAGTLEHQIELQLNTVDKHQPQSLIRASQRIKSLIEKTPLPIELSTDIAKAYHKIGRSHCVAIRSSKTHPQLPNVHSTWLNIHGDANVIESVRKVWSSIFEPKMILFIIEHLTPITQMTQAVMIQRMAQSRVSGIAYSKNPFTNNKRTVVIDAIWGLGEYLLDHQIQADRYELEKDTWSVSSRSLHPQQFELILHHQKNQELEIPESRKLEPKLTDKQLQQIAQLTVKVQQLLFFPQKMEWAYEENTLFILQTQQLTEQFLENSVAKNEDERLHQLTPLLYGSSVQSGLISGQVRVCHKADEYESIQPGEILVVSKLPSLHLHTFRKAAAIICDTPLFPRDVFSLAVPCVANTHFGSSVLKNGQLVTVDGQQGTVYEGSLEYNTHKPNSIILKKRTQVFLSTGEPDAAPLIRSLQVDGIGLLRAEYMYASLGIHPKKLLKDGKEELLIKTLIDGIRKLSISVDHQPVYYRFSDLTTREYKQLVAGSEFEPEEENPLLGYRGAMRYITDILSFDLELRAIQTLRKEGLLNVHVMIPFLRSVDEYILIKKHLARYDLLQSKDFQIWIMIDVPAVAYSLELFLEQGVDGVAIGAKDLIALFTGVIPSDNTTFATSYFEQVAVQQLLKHIIKTTHNFSRPVIFCEHQLSQKMIEFLLSVHIDGISVNRKQVEYVQQITQK